MLGLLYPMSQNKYGSCYLCKQRLLRKTPEALRYRSQQIPIPVRMPNAFWRVVRTAQQIRSPTVRIRDFHSNNIRFTFFLIQVPLTYLSWQPSENVVETAQKSFPLIPLVLPYKPRKPHHIPTNTPVSNTRTPATHIPRPFY